MLYLIGLGLKPKHLTLEALDALKECSEVYLDSYTSKFAEGTVNELESLIGKEIISLNRGKLESDELIVKAKTQNIALLVYGNVFFATTHVQFLLDAKEKEVKTKFMPGISLQNYLGATGLDQYKFGRIVSIVFPKENYAPESFFDSIKSNFEAGLHTLCLLDLDTEINSFMSIQQALKILNKIAVKRKELFLDEVQMVLIAGAGSNNQIIKSGTIKEFMRSGYSAFPQSLIICGKLTEKEKESLDKL
ncbi:MAG: diphthine synthase [Candidatus Diapherotrites archaeon]|nr:diphthine synthase [Candidatus Diapherotrites archaeon]